MTDIPRVFDDNGALIAIDVTKLPADMAERYRAIVAAYEANKQAESALAGAQAEVTAALTAVRNVTEYHDARWPKQSFHDLWLSNFGGGPANAKRARGLT